MWGKEIEIARKAAEKSGLILKKMFGNINIIKKKGKIDLVTEADLKSEKIILDIITRTFPHDSILTEESGEHTHFPERLWIIDPLDGTTNFAHKFPFFAVSIALEVEGKQILGLVYNPYSNEQFEAIDGKGAFLNGNPIYVSHTKKLKDSLLATGFPYSIYKKPDTIMELFKRMTVLSQGVRRPGSAAIDLCYVAAGRLDGFWEEELMPWDTAAGSLIVREAGGLVTDYLGNHFTPFKKSIIAANQHIHPDMVSSLGSVKR